MTNDEFDIIKKQLDSALSAAEKGVGICFGTELYSELQRRGLIQDADFQAIGFPWVVIQYPVYSQRAAHQDLDLPLDGFKIGKR